MYTSHQMFDQPSHVPAPMGCNPSLFFLTSELSSSVAPGPAPVPTRCITSSIICFNELPPPPLNSVVYHISGLYLLKNQLKEARGQHQIHCQPVLKSKDPPPETHRLNHSQQQSLTTSPQNLYSPHRHTAHPPLHHQIQPPHSAHFPVPKSCKNIKVASSNG